MSTTKYTGLVTSEHADKPNYMATIAASVQPFTDVIAMYQLMQLSYDIDVGAGDQLDKIGQWVGITRNLQTPISGLFFTFDTGPGFDKGILIDDSATSTSLTVLDDYHYRLVLKVKILNNHWDGTNKHFQDISAALFPVSGLTLFVQDLANMTINLGYVEHGVSPIAIALLTGGYLDLKPATITIANYLYTP